MNIKISKYDVQRALEKIIDEQLIIMNRIKHSQAYRKDECLQRVELIEKRDTYDYILNLFGVQSFEYTKEDFNSIVVD